MATLKISDLSVGDWVRYGGIDYQVKSIHGDFESVTSSVTKSNEMRVSMISTPSPSLQRYWKRMSLGDAVSNSVYTNILPCSAKY